MINHLTPSASKFALRVDGTTLEPVFDSVEDAEAAISPSAGTRVEIVDAVTGQVVKIVTAQLG